MPPIRLVIADDHALFREGLKRIFSFEEDIAVVGEASNGDEVADVVQSAKPDVLLLDLKMPRGDVLQTLRKVGEKNPSTRVLVLTAFAEEEKVINVARSGARGYLLKGVDSGTLLQAVKTVHAGEVWIDTEAPAAEAFEKIARSISSGSIH